MVGGKLWGAACVTAPHRVHISQRSLRRCCFCHLAFGVVLENALTHGTDFRSTDRPGNGLFKHLQVFSVCLPDQIADLLSNEKQVDIHQKKRLHW